MNNFVIIIEGQDRTGKDTLIKNLVKDNFDRQPFIIHCIGTKEKGEKGKELSRQYYSELFNLINKSNNNFILNRSHIGENIYSPIYREYDGSYVFELEKKLTKPKKYFLFCLIDSSGRALEREDNNSLSKGDKELFFDEQQKFVLSIVRSNIKNCTKVIIDIKDKTTEDVFNQVKQILKENL